MFQCLLGVPQVGVRAVSGQQMGVGTALRGPAVLHHIDAIGGFHVGQAVRDQDHRFGACHGADAFHNVVFTLHVDVGSGFVKDIHRAVVQDGPGQGQALALPAGQIGPPLGHRGIKPLFAAEEIRQIGGRAGRFGVYDEGFVTATIDSETIWQGFSAPVEPIKQAMLGFSDLVLRVDHDLLEVLQVWNSIPAIEPYKKMPIDRYIFILKTLQECGLALDKEQSLRAATIPFDEREEELMDYFLLYCGQYLAGREIEWPRRGKSSLDGLELYSQMLDLYYSFCRAFRQPVDLDWLRTEKENTALQINELLVRELSQKGKSCQVCHAPMPISSKFRVCYKCMMKRKKQSHIQMHGKKSG